MFPADCVLSNYVEARRADDAQRAQKMAANNDNKALAQPTPQRPAGPARTISSTLFGFFPSASTSGSQATSAATSPSATPMPSPSLNAPAKQPWFAPRPIPKATDMDITCLPPAWS